jgi:hypothetical protein
MDSNRGMPSIWRRMVVTALHLVPLTVVSAVLWLVVLMDTSDACQLGGTRWCSVTERAWLNGVAMGWAILTALCALLGWRGRLWGARR